MIWTTSICVWRSMLSTQFSSYRIDIVDAELYYVPNWLSQHDCVSNWYQQLADELAWQQDEIKVFGKLHRIPRLQAWYGDAEASYRYSGQSMQPRPWSSSLSRLRHALAHDQLVFNSVLANWYRDGHDKMGWHSDNESELGRNPTIASISVGSSRTFQLKHRITSKRIDLELEDGSLLIMAGAMQHFWQHALPARKRISQGRINLTFRQVAQL